jgi:hypothetical protein
MSEIADIGQHLMTMRESIAAFTEAANARREWENFVERDSTQLSESLQQMTEAAETLSTSVDEIISNLGEFTAAVELARSLLANQDELLRNVQESLDEKFQRMNLKFDDLLSVKLAELLNDQKNSQELNRAALEKLDVQVQQMSIKEEQSKKAIHSQLVDLKTSLVSNINNNLAQSKGNTGLHVQKILAELGELKEIVNSSFFLRVGARKSRVNRSNS